MKSTILSLELLEILNVKQNWKPKLVGIMISNFLLKNEKLLITAVGNMNSQSRLSIGRPRLVYFHLMSINAQQHACKT